MKKMYKNLNRCSINRSAVLCFSFLKSILNLSEQKIKMRTVLFLVSASLFVAYAYADDGSIAIFDNVNEYAIAFLSKQSERR